MKPSRSGTVVGCPDREPQAPRGCTGPDRGEAPALRIEGRGKLAPAGYFVSPHNGLQDHRGRCSLRGVAWSSSIGANSPCRWRPGFAR